MESKNYISLCFVTSITFYLHVYQCPAFLLSSECPAPSPCKCSGRSGDFLNIQCESKGLTAIPQFGQYATTVYNLHIYLSLNRLRSIPNGVFRNLSSINAEWHIELKLDNNNINTIEDDAFKDLEHIFSLELQNNNLTTIPFAISKLTHLQYLYITANPLRSISSLVMFNIGRSLVRFELDIDRSTSWPTELHYLSTLQFLYINYIPFAHLDIGAFRGFEKSLVHLSMRQTKLEKIPYAVCRLSNLRSLTFDYNFYVKENMSSIIVQCGHTLPKVTTFYFGGISLHKFPDVFSLFPSLTIIVAGGNRFKYIDDAVIPSVSNLTAFHLGFNLFERIPSALNKLKSLEFIDLRNNQIMTVEYADLNGLSNLKTLYLNNNPIAYVSSGAFGNNPNLNHLELENTQLDYVPEGITHLSNLKTFVFSGHPIDCTCEMSYLKHWNASAVTTFDTLCNLSNETIKTFVSTFLQSCPVV